MDAPKKKKMHSEVKEVTDFFVSYLINKIPRFKVNSLAQELANTLLTRTQADSSKEERDLPKNREGFWIMRNADYVCPMLVNILDKVAISIKEFLEYTPGSIYFKIEIGKISWICNNQEPKVMNLAAFADKPYFEIPMRVLKAAIQQCLDMLVYRYTFGADCPNDFIPLILVAPGGSDAKLDFTLHAVGLPMYYFSADQLNKTTFGSHNSAQVQLSDSFAELTLDGPTIESPLFSEKEKVDFFSAGWYERIVTSQMIIEYAEQSKTDSSILDMP